MSSCTFSATFTAAGAFYTLFTNQIRGLAVLENQKSTRFVQGKSGTAS
jgi:hypothetical protein